jgi:hypothetical protein
MALETERTHIEPETNERRTHKTTSSTHEVHSATKQENTQEMEGGPKKTEKAHKKQGAGRGNNNNNNKRNIR